MRRVVKEKVWQEGLKFDPTQLDWRAGGRQVLGLALGFALAWAATNLQLALAVLLGGFVAALRGQSGPSQMRRRLLLGEIVLLGAGVGLSIRASGDDLTAALVPGTISAAFALSAAANPFYQAVMTSCVSYVVVYAGAGVSPEQAWLYAAAILAGGLWQFVYLSRLWPLRPFAPEWSLMAGLYAALVEKVEKGSGELTLAQHAEFAEAQNVAVDRFPPRLQAAHILFCQHLHAAGLLDAALSDPEALDDWHEPERGALAEMLRKRAEHLRTGQTEPGAEEQAEWDAWRAAQTGRVETGRVAETVRRAFGLLKQPATYVELRPSGYKTLWQELSGPLRDPRQLAYAGFFGLSVAGLLYAVDLADWNHGHWLVMTYVLIMSADYQQLLSRGLARVVGTLAGVLLLGLSQALLGDPLGLRLLWLFAALYLMLSGGNAGYGLISFGFTVHALAVLWGAGLSAALPERLWMTALGVLAALLMYRLWPNWKPYELHEHLTEAAATLRDLLSACAHWEQDAKAPAQAQRAALLLGPQRAELERQVTLARLEPSRGRAPLAPDNAALHLGRLDVLARRAMSRYAQLSLGTLSAAQAHAEASQDLADLQVLTRRVSEFAERKAAHTADLTKP